MTPGQQTHDRNPPLRKEDLNEYIAFRARLDELIHLWDVWAKYGNSTEAKDKDIASTIGIAVQVWLHSFFDPDPRGLDVLRLWPAVFPTLKAGIRAWKAKHKKVLKVLKDFRHTTGAHFSRRLEEHERARRAFTPDLVSEATESFMEIAQEVLRHESERPELVASIKSHGLPPGSA